MINGGGIIFTNIREKNGFRTLCLDQVEKVYGRDNCQLYNEIEKELDQINDKNLTALLGAVYQIAVQAKENEFSLSTYDNGGYENLFYLFGLSTVKPNEKKDINRNSSDKTLGTLSLYIPYEFWAYVRQIIKNYFSTDELFYSSQADENGNIIPDIYSIYVNVTEEELSKYTKILVDESGIKYTEKNRFELEENIKSIHFILDSWLSKLYKLNKMCSHQLWSINEDTKKIDKEQIEYLTANKHDDIPVLNTERMQRLLYIKRPENYQEFVSLLALYYQMIPVNEIEKILFSNNISIYDLPCTKQAVIRYFIESGCNADTSIKNMKEIQRHGKLKKTSEDNNFDGYVIKWFKKSGPYKDELELQEILNHLLIFSYYKQNFYKQYHEIMREE